MIQVDIEKFRLPEGVELRLQEEQALSIALVNGVVNTNYASREGGASARAFRQGYWGFAADPMFDDDAVDAVIRLAVVNAETLARRLGGDRRLAPFDPVRVTADFSTRKPRRSHREYLEFLREIDAYLQKTYPGLSTREVWLSSQTIEKRLLTSEGAVARTIVPRVKLGVGMTVIKNGEPTECLEPLGGLGEFEDHFDRPEDLFSRFHLLHERLMRKRDGVQPRPGVFDVVIDSRITGILAHEAVGHTVEYDGVQGGSVAGRFRDREVAAPIVNMTDFASHWAGGQCPVPVVVDDEGVRGEDAVLIKDGVLRNYMHNRETAALTGDRPLGNARASEFSDEPIIRMRNTGILPGNDRLEDMIASIDDGYYFTDYSGGQADMTGEFMFGVSEGREIRHGKLGAGLRDSTITGVAFEMLKSVSMIGDDMDWNGFGLCGKKQRIAVGTGGPSVKCRIKVGGRS
jgi:TldD protein